MFIKVGEKGTIINTEHVARVRRYHLPLQGPLATAFFLDGASVDLRIEDYDYFNSMAMVPGESKPSGKWCDPVVRDEKINKEVAEWLVGTEHVHYDYCISQQEPRGINRCNCGYLEAVRYAQSILEQSDE